MSLFSNIYPASCTEETAGHNWGFELNAGIETRHGQIPVGMGWCAGTEWVR